MLSSVSVRIPRTHIGSFSLPALVSRVCFGSSVCLGDEVMQPRRQSACVSVLGAHTIRHVPYYPSYTPLLAASLGIATQLEDLHLGRGYSFLRQSTKEGTGHGSLWPAEALAVSLSLPPLSTGHWFYYNAALGSRPLMA